MLVVDDEVTNLNTFRRVFRADFDVVAAIDGASALRLLQAEAFDVVMSDYSMPGMNGVELLKEVSKTWPNIARLLITAHQDLNDVLLARDSGLAAGIVPKPWTREHILRWIDNLTRLSAMRVAVAQLRNDVKR